MLSAIVVRSLRYRRYRTAVDTVGTSLYTRRGEWSPLGLDHLGTSPLLACILRAAVPTAELAIARPSVDIIVSDVNTTSRRLAFWRVPTSCHLVK